MLFKGTQKGPDREYYLSVGGKLWMPAERGPAMFRPSWGDLLKLGYMKVFGIEVVSMPPAMAGGSGFSGGGGGGSSSPMTTLGDLITGGASGTPGRLGIGATNDVLTVQSGAPAWAAPTPSTDRFVLNHPGFKAGSGGAAPADSTTYYLVPGNFYAVVNGADANARNPIGINCTLTAMYVHVRVGTAATAGFNVTHAIRKNNTTDSGTVTLEYTSASALVPATGSNAALSLTFTAGDDFSQKVVTPAWTPTNPLGVFPDAALVFTIP